MKRLALRPFALLGVNADETPARFREVAARERITWPCLFDGGCSRGPVAIRWGVTGWPTIYVLDVSGVIRYRDVRGPALDQAVDVLLAEVSAAPR